MVERFSATVIFTAEQASYINQDVKATALPTFAAIATNGAGPNTFAPTAGAGSAGTVGHAFTAGAGTGSAAGGATPGGNGGVASLTSGVGGASDGTNAAGVGGDATVTGGIGGIASAAIAGGMGGQVVIAGGVGGAGTGTGLGGDSGGVAINGGAGGADGGAGIGADGEILIGSANTANIEFGNVTDNPASNFLGTGLVTMPALTVDGVGGIITLTPGAQAGGGGTVGSAITATAGAGSAAGGIVAGANGGVAAIAGGAGGASDGTNAAGLGAAATLAGGVGGVAHTAIDGGVGGALGIAGGAGGAGVAGAFGGAGGDATLNAGAGGVTGGGGAGANGVLYLGAANSSAISIGNVTDNPLFSFLGSGDVSLLGGGDLRYGRLVQVVITAVGGTTGATPGTLDVQVNDLNGTAVTRAVTLFMDSTLTQYAGSHTASGTGFFGASSVGTLVAGTGTLHAVITTNATGHYVSVTDNAADETCWFSARTAEGGHVDAAAGCVVVDCIPDDATWN